MTRRLFQNQQKITGIQEALNAATNRPEVTDEFGKRKLIASLQNPASTGLSRRLPLWIPVAAGLILVLGVLFALRLFSFSPPSSPKDISAHRTAPAPLPLIMRGLVKSLPLHENLEVDSEHGAKFVMTDDSTLWVDSNTRMTFNTDAGDLNMDHGRLLARFNKRITPTRIQTADGTIHIVGTVFTVSVGDFGTEVRLFEGNIILQIHGKKESIPTHSYIRFQNGTVTQRRALDASDVISALLIPEKTFHFSGPKVPSLSIPKPPAPETAAAGNANTAPAKVETKRVARRSVPAALQNPPANTADSDSAAYQLPPEDDMQVEHQAAPPKSTAVAPTVPTAEQLLEDACDSLKNGHHEQGKAKIRDYLKEHPDDRYWEHVHSIFE